MYSVLLKYSIHNDFLVLWTIKLKQLLPRVKYNINPLKYTYKYTIVYNIQIYNQCRNYLLQSIDVSGTKHPFNGPRIYTPRSTILYYTYFQGIFYNNYINIRRTSIYHDVFKPLSIKKILPTQQKLYKKLRLLLKY